HLADAAPAQKSGEGKEYRHYGFLSLTPPSRDKKAVYVVGRASPVSPAEGIFFFVELGQGCLSEGRGGSQERNSPHPDDTTRASRGDGRHHTYQVAHAHPGGRGDDEGLDSRYSLLLRDISLFHCHPDHLREHAERHEPRPNGEINPRRHKD